MCLLVIAGGALVYTTHESDMREQQYRATHPFVDALGHKCYVQKNDESNIIIGKAVVNGVVEIHQLCRN